MAAHAKIVDLRNVLATRFPQTITSTTGRLPTGVPELDEITGGGLCKSAITELITPKLSAGSALLICALLESACKDRYFVVLIDGRDSFDPSGLGPLPLKTLLWIRCTGAIEAMKAADLLLRDGNFPLVILDLVLNPAAELRKIPQTSWYRLQRLVESAPTACLVMARHGMVSSAHLKIVLETDRTLPELENGDAISRFGFHVERRHFAELAKHQSAF